MSDHGCAVLSYQLPVIGRICSRKAANLSRWTVEYRSPASQGRGYAAKCVLTGAEQNVPDINKKSRNLAVVTEITHTFRGGIQSCKAFEAESHLWSVCAKSG